MADVNAMISKGLGSPAAVEFIVTFGLTPSRLAVYAKRIYTPGADPRVFTPTDEERVYTPPAVPEP